MHGSYNHDSYTNALNQSLEDRKRYSGRQQRPMKMCEQVSGAMSTSSGSDDSVNHKRYGGDVVTCGNDVMCLQEDSTGDWMMNQQLQSSEREARGEHGAPYMVGYNPNAE